MLSGLERTEAARINSLVGVAAQSHRHLSQQTDLYQIRWLINGNSRRHKKTYLAQTKKLSSTSRKKYIILELTLNP
jgi:hypothetical protein